MCRVELFRELFTIFIDFLNYLFCFDYKKTLTD